MAGPDTALSFPCPKETLMKITLKSQKPRNPFVAASLRRHAGSHSPRSGTARQQAATAMRREIAASADRYKPSP
jgi:hypothetical protein